MKKLFVFGILVLILGVFVFAQEKDTIKVSEVEKYQPQIDTLKAEFEKVKKDAYEKAIEGANRSVNISILVVTFVSLFVAGLGLIGYFKIRDVRAEIKKQLEEAQKIKHEAESCLSEIKTKGIEADKVLGDLKSKSKSQMEVQPSDFTKEVAELTTKDARDAIKAYEDLSDRIFGEDIYEAMAYNYYKVGEFEKCINELRKYLKVNPTDANAYFNWGNALSDLADLKKDEALYKESFEKYALAVKYKVDKHEAYNNWGVALSDLADLKKDKALYKESSEKYALAVKYKEDYHEAYSNWGVALSDLADLMKDEALYGESIEKHDKAIGINPKDANAWYNRACAFSLWGKREEALEDLRKAIELDVKDKEDAKKDEDFNWLWEDEGFKRLVE